MDTIPSIHAPQQGVEVALESSDDSVDQETQDINSTEECTELQTMRELNLLPEKVSVNFEESGRDKKAAHKANEETHNHHTKETNWMPNDESARETLESTLAAEEHFSMAAIKEEISKREYEPEEKMQMPNNQIANSNEYADLVFEGRKMLFTPQYAWWIAKVYVYERSKLLHHTQRKEQAKKRENSQDRAKTRTPSQLQFQKSWEAVDAKRRERETRKARFEFRMKYGIDYIEVKRTEAEKSLKDQPILGRVRCHNPSPLRKCLTVLSEEELDAWVNGMKQNGTETSFISARDRVNLLESLSSPASNLTRETSQVPRRSRAWSNLFKLRGLRGQRQ